MDLRAAGRTEILVTRAGVATVIKAKGINKITVVPEKRVRLAFNPLCHHQGIFD
jgi:hypothetical protein